MCRWDLEIDWLRKRSKSESRLKWNAITQGMWKMDLILLYNPLQIVSTEKLL